MACGGILLALCLGGAGLAPDAAAAEALPARGGPDPLGLLLVAVMPLALGLFVWRRWYALGERPRWFSAFPPPIAVAMIVAMLLLGMAGAAIVRLLLGADSGGGDAADVPLADQALMLAGHAAGQAIVVAVFAWRAGTARAQPGRPEPGRACLAGVGAYLLVWPMVATAAFASGLLARWISDEPLEPIAHDTLQVLVDSPPTVWFLLLAGLVVLVIPVLEEVMYRGMLQRALVEVVVGRWPAILLTSAMFALMHMGTARWHALPAVFVLSLGFGWIYERTGRLSACIVMHMLFNAVNLTLARLTLPGA